MKYLRSLLIPLLCLTPVDADYADDASSAIKTLQDKWYDTNTGLWNKLWWQSGNIVETIAIFGKQDASFKPTAIAIISNTYDKSRNQLGYKDWKNDYYDDMGWWAMAWIASFDLTGDAKYLATAKDLFEDMTGGWTTPCNGGIWWNKQHDSIASISNELFLAVSASLANRVAASEKAHFVNWAQMEWDWFWRSGVINKDGLVNDGIDKKTCKNDGKTTYTYNQGVVLAGLSELAKAKSDGGFIAHANAIATATISKLTDNGILTEPVGSGPLDDQGAMFKGAFVRGLASLNGNERRQEYTDFLRRNAESAWRQERGEGGVVVDRWQGGSRNVNPGSQASAVDVLVAAAGTE
ncbi:glycosyl hydrolase [Ophiobolus disseminans]|uniref:Glycosyl hydrolase n=1 Tax=Ophiobolus disseminans TaxID=1469910 RepID=A0A6A7AAI8_9PLEO|nr:glycosyl hydrolase [Ophiobolus disseminans]